MPTKEEWIKVHADLMAKFNLPCKLKFTCEQPVGFHRWNYLSSCGIYVNLDAKFRVPEHLILHEAAHHRAWDWYTTMSHDEDWARVLWDMYRESGIALPRTTGFKEFARVTGIVHKVFNAEESQQLMAIAENPHLLEGA